MIFMMFVSTSAIMVMSFTMTCRCWIDSDPEKQALMMVLTGSPAVSRGKCLHLAMPPRGQLGDGEKHEPKRGSLARQFSIPNGSTRYSSDPWARVADDLFACAITIPAFYETTNDTGSGTSIQTQGSHSSYAIRYHTPALVWAR